MSVTITTIAGTTIGTWTDHHRLVRRGAGRKRGRNYQIPYRHGLYAVEEKWFAPTRYELEVRLKDNVETNLSGMLAAFHDALGLVTIVGSNSVAGTVRTQVELLRDPQQLEPGSRIWTFDLNCPAGHWEDNAATSVGPATNPSITTSGDLPIDDMVVTFATTGTSAHTDSNGTVSNLGGSTGAGTNFVVDCGARTIQTSTGGNIDNRLIVSQPWWWRFEAGSTQGFSGPSITVEYRNKWAI